MANFPVNLIAIVDRAAAAHPTSIEAAVAEAKAYARLASNYAEFVEQLIDGSIQELVYDARHKVNVSIKRQAGHYGKPALVEGCTGAISDAYRSVYDYFVGGCILGNLMGRELSTLASSERAKAGGHLFNAQLLSELTALVPEGERVRDAVTEPRLRAMFKKVHGEVQAHEAA